MIYLKAAVGSDTTMTATTDDGEVSFGDLENCRSSTLRLKM